MDTLSLLYVHTGETARPVPLEALRGAAEVIEAGVGQATLEDAARRLGIPYRMVSTCGGACRALNLAASYASSAWIVLSYDDSPFPGDAVREIASAVLGSPACAHVFEHNEVAALPWLAIKREALLYGAFDGRFVEPRLAALHWLKSIFPAAKRRYAPCEGVVRSDAPWITEGMPALLNPEAALFAFWEDMSPGARAALLGQVIEEAAESSRRLEQLREVQLRRVRQGRENPYRQGDYDPRRFWESNTEEYVKWEIFQPDESEISDIVGRVQPQRLLELGCGAGRNIRFFESVQAYVGMDISTNLLSLAADRANERTLGLVCGDAVELCFAANSFDMVFANSTLQHVEPDRIADCVAEILRVASRYVCIVEFTQEEDGTGTWFEQTHMFRHDYESLFGDACEMLEKREVSFKVQPAVKHLFLFEKQGAAGAVRSGCVTCSSPGTGSGPCSQSGR